MGRKPCDFTGQRFGHLVALERTNRQVANGLNYYWKCQCDCGKLTEVSTAHLRAGDTISCGCAKYRRKYE